MVVERLRRVERARPDDLGQHELWASASEALRLATVEPTRAQELGRSVAKAGATVGDWASVSLAQRASGVAAMQERRLDLALVELRKAVVAAGRADNDQLRGEANMSLAAALVFRGSPSRAFEAIQAALEELSGVPAARALTQRSAILQSLGRNDEALEDLRRALPVLRRADDAQWETRALSNRSLLLTGRRMFAAAETDLLRAQDLADRHDLTLAGAYVQQNLGCVAADRGDVPAALAYFDAAEERYRQMNLEVGSLFIDRAKVLLSVRLINEARQTAESAVAAFAGQKRKFELPEAQLLLSTTALLQRDADTALAAAGSAFRGFARLGKHQSMALAHYAQVQAQIAQGQQTQDAESPSNGARTQPSTQGVVVSGASGRVAVRPTRLRACAVELERAGWMVPALEARLLAGRLALSRGEDRMARVDLALVARARRRGPADARARAWMAEAMLREANGSRRGAKSALRAGLRVLDEHRATIGATELRAHVSAHRGALAQAGLRLALAERDARGVHWWGDHGRATANLLRPVQPPDDSVLAGSLQELRATMTEIESGRNAGTSTSALVAHQVELERQIRDYCRRFPGAAGQLNARLPSVSEIAAELQDVALVEYVELDHLLHAVTIVDGRVRLTALGPTTALRQAMVHLPFALHRMARRGVAAAHLQAAHASLRHVSQVLQDSLLAPLARQLGDRPLLVVPTGWLQSVPWSIVPACVGRPVAVAPSAALWKAANDRRPPSDGRVVVIAGPGLANAEAEARTVAALYPNASLHVGDDATCAAISTALDGADIAHVAAHGSLRSDNPLFSSLRLSDGPFTVYDIERLGRTPRHVILAACDTAMSHVTAGEEILGLAAALLNHQTANLVAPLIPIPDAETAPIMASYHQQLRTGVSSAEALAVAQQRHLGDGPQAYASAAGFVCLGAGHKRRGTVTAPSPITTAPSPITTAPSPS